MKNITNRYKHQLEEALNEIRTPGLRKKQIPNILTATRLLAPFIIIPSVVTGNFALAGISTILFSATDLVDGFIARKLNATSDLGKDLDAATDKVFIETLMISLIVTNVFYLLPFIMESIISSINIIKKIKNKNPETAMIGKVKMTSLYLLVALGFINMYLPTPEILFNLLYLTTLGLQAITIKKYCSKDKNNYTNNTKVKEIENIEENSKDNQKTMTQKRIEKYKNLRRIIEEQKNIETLNKNKEKEENPKVKIKK